jgi:predicted N-formylglutamate amidohydrolase
MQQREKLRRLLGDADPQPIEFCNKSGAARVLLVCEHAGQLIPSALGDLGVSESEMARHIGWDIGAASVTKKLAKLLDAQAILQRYSRLVIDCNRPPEAPDAMPEIADNTIIFGNQHLTEIEKAQRADEIFWPFHRAVDQAIRSGQFDYVISIHSFTPRLAGQDRPWPLAFLYRGDAVTPSRLAKAIKRKNPDLNIGMNEPYQIDDESDWFVPKHGEENKIAHALIEIRNDEIGDELGQGNWAKILAAAINELLEEVK